VTDVAIESVTDLADRFWQWFLSRSPIYATILGDERYDDRLADVTDFGRAEERRALRAFLDDVHAVERDALDVEDAITADMIETVARIWIRQIDHNVHHFDAIDQSSGPQNLPGDLARFQRMDTPERVDKLIRRLEQYPDYLAAHRANLLEGIAAKRTAAAPVVARVVDQTRRAVEGGADQSPLLVSHPELDD